MRPAATSRSVIAFITTGSMRPSVFPRGGVLMFRNNVFSRTTPIDFAILHLLNDAFRQIHCAHERCREVSLCMGLVAPPGSMPSLVAGDAVPASVGTKQQNIGIFRQRQHRCQRVSTHCSPEVAPKGEQAAQPGCWLCYRAGPRPSAWSVTCNGAPLGVVRHLQRWSRRRATAMPVCPAPSRSR
jgi:hypothetical protein